MWYQFCLEIDDALAGGDLTWAEATLTDIKETVERTQQVTPGQRTAVDHIINARSARGRSRRGEGFSGRRW